MKYSFLCIVENLTDILQGLCWTLWKKTNTYNFTRTSRSFKSVIFEQHIQMAFWFLLQRDNILTYALAPWLNLLFILSVSVLKHCQLLVTSTCHPMTRKAWFKEKLSYHWGTTLGTVSVETVRNVAQMFVELHLISPVTGDWPSR